MNVSGLRWVLLLTVSLVVACRAQAQAVGTFPVERPTGETSAGRFFTTTGVSLAFPVSALRKVAGNGRGTSFTLEYRINSRVSVAGAWDANLLPVQTARLVANVDPALQRIVSELKGVYQANAFGAYIIWYGKDRPLKPYLTGGVGLNSITVPQLVYDAQTQLLSLESASKLNGFVSGGFGINWQFSKPVAAFGEANAYVVPASSPVAVGSNSYLTAKLGLRFPLF
ncbi:hypothetical protein [Fibrella arboris]|uniref:hypothetical protein n=1 Tax=Fibrella arboris TaxID=3242486 RepID=UPI00352004FA